MTQVVEILPCGFLVENKDPFILYSIPWLLMIWQQNGPGHQQQWYWLSSPKIFIISLIALNKYMHLHMIPLLALKCLKLLYPPPLQRSWKGGVYWFHLVRPSVRPFSEVINGIDIRPDSTHLSLYDILVQAPSRAGFCTGNWSSLSLPVQTCFMLWVCSYWETSVRAWNIHARWGF